MKNNSGRVQRSRTEHAIKTRVARSKSRSDRRAMIAAYRARRKAASKKSARGATSSSSTRSVPATPLSGGAGGSWGPAMGEIVVPGIKKMNSGFGIPTYNPDYQPYKSGPIGFRKPIPKHGISATPFPKTPVTPETYRDGFSKNNTGVDPMAWAKTPLGRKATPLAGILTPTGVSTPSVNTSGLVAPKQEGLPPVTKSGIMGSVNTLLQDSTHQSSGISTPEHAPSDFDAENIIKTFGDGGMSRDQIMNILVSRYGAAASKYSGILDDYFYKK